MSIHSVSVPGQISVPPRPTREGVGEGSVPVETPSRSVAVEPPASLGVAALAPLGTDPALWSVLTTEERAYFEHAQALGPVTYGPGTGTAEPALPRGARLDLRV